MTRMISRAIDYRIRERRKLVAEEAGGPENGLMQKYGEGSLEAVWDVRWHVQEALEVEDD